MTNKYTSGDLVEAVKGETVIRGRAHEVTALGSLTIGEHTAAITWYERQGFTVTIIEKAPLKVPTEPGAYATRYGALFVLKRDGNWLDFSLFTGVENNAAANNPAYHPFTRLEPVAETAKKVLDRLSSWWEFGPPPKWATEIANIAAEFGVEW